MQATIHLDPMLQQWANGATEATVEARTALEAVRALTKLYPALGGRLLNCDGELRGIAKLRRGDLALAPTDALRDGDSLQLSIG